MYKALFFALLASLLFGGCSKATYQVAVKDEAPMYVDENTLILFAFDAQNRHNNAEAVGYFDLLYTKTQDNIYRDQAMGALMRGGYYNDIVSRLTERRQKGEVLSDKSLRYLIIALLAKNETADAKKEAVALIDKSRTEQNYLLLAEVYLAEHNDLEAMSSLEKAYGLNYSEQVLDKLSVVLYRNINNPHQAIARIEEHLKNLGDSLLLLKRLAAFYGDQRDEEGLLKIYPRLYKLEPTPQNADILIQLYWNAKKWPELTQFLEQTNNNDDLLLKLYTSEKVYTKAISLAQKLYEETGEIDYLGQKAIYQYEAAKKRDKKLIDGVISDLTKVVETKEEGYYLNYLGYCMIEHDRNVTAGIGYVKRALALEPDSGYFIDSLAWGYYKQGKCQEAMGLMDRVVERLGADDPEVKAHLNAINTCIKKEK